MPCLLVEKTLGLANKMCIIRQYIAYQNENIPTYDQNDLIIWKNKELCRCFYKLFVKIELKIKYKQNYALWDCISCELVILTKTHIPYITKWEGFIKKKKTEAGCHLM